MDDIDRADTVFGAALDSCDAFVSIEEQIVQAKLTEIDERLRILEEKAKCLTKVGNELTEAIREITDWIELVGSE